MIIAHNKKPGFILSGKYNYFVNSHPTPHKFSISLLEIPLKFDCFCPKINLNPNPRVPAFQNRLKAPWSFSSLTPIFPWVQILFNGRISGVTVKC